MRPALDKAERRALDFYILLPRALPWAMEILPFQGVLVLLNKQGVLVLLVKAERICPTG